MSDKMNEEMLAQFDAAFRAKFGCGISEASAAQDEDSMAIMGAAMWAWQASRAVIEVELPEMEWLHHDEAREAIESLGLKVKP